jgi:predicted phosphoribosyltransferase
MRPSATPVADVDSALARQVQTLSYPFNAADDLDLLLDLIVILVDDGLGAGSTMRAGAEALRQQ